MLHPPQFLCHRSLNRIQFLIISLFFFYPLLSLFRFWIISVWGARHHLSGKVTSNNSSCYTFTYVYVNLCMLLHFFRFTVTWSSCFSLSVLIFFWGYSLLDTHNSICCCFFVLFLFWCGSFG